jgi:hypothetical protein
VDIQFFQHHSLESFLQRMFWPLCWESHSYICLGYFSILFHWSSFVSVFVPVPWWFFCYFNVIWSHILWCLQHCSFCSGLPWLFRVFYASIWILWFFLFLWSIALEFHGNCFEFVDHFW